MERMLELFSHIANEASKICELQNKNKQMMDNIMKIYKDNFSITKYKNKYDNDALLVKEVANEFIERYPFLEDCCKTSLEKSILLMTSECEEQIYSIKIGGEKTSLYIWNAHCIPSEKAKFYEFN